ncbi:uncharacterized protein LOC110243861 [Exaiptasia diaphana]|uniref:Uncharacterized protein n=1 Tax=Exaiptasia diaphana TaxID=2652724 RepID=A0A913XKJ7_EXADI|nr:uncharacterized protein LOC110243861 [Exaiptasia diaphana]
MHLVVIHGYILSGTGSNIYTTNVAKTWKKQGHAVTVVCQDPFADKLEFVDEFYTGTDAIPSFPPKEGTIRVVVPDIHGLLLVYSYDKYPGYEVKTMNQCTIEEIDAHIKATSEGLRRVVNQGVDMILTNHIILSPVIASRATKDTKVPYVCKLHGSAMIFSVKTRTNELKPYVLEGLRDCKRVIAGTNHVEEMALEILQEEREEMKLKEKMVIIPPGLDPDVFQSGGELHEKQEAFLASVKAFIDRNPNGRKDSAILHLPINSQDMHASLVEAAHSYDQRAIDADLIERWVPFEEGQPIICYFGNFLDTKGVGELLTAFPSILDRVPEARLLLIGFGRYREHLEGMLRSLREGNVEAFKAYANAGKFVDLPDDLDRYFRQLRPVEQNRVTITGYQQHAQLKEILPLASLSIVGAKATEAFGMVTVEAMSAGVLPLCHNHSGLAEVLDVVREEDPDMEKRMRLDARPGGSRGTADGAFLIQHLPEKVHAALKFLYPKGFHDYEKRREVSARLREVAISQFSWGDLCKKISDLRELPDIV